MNAPSKRWLRNTCGAACVAMACAALWFVWPMDVPEFASVQAHWTPSDAYLLDRNGVLLDQERINFKVRRLPWTTLNAISPALLDAIVDGEDHRFFTHHGIDWRAFVAALRDDSVARRRRGASTITMQLAALLDPSVRAGNGTGAWHRKLSQMRAARAIERHWTKREILEAYVNLLDFRGELQGVAAASQALAGKAPSGLDLAESLVLAALLPAPGATPQAVVGRACGRASARHLAVDCAGIRAAADVLLRNTAAPDIAPLAQLSNSQVSSARLSNARLSNARLAPHLAHALLHDPGERLRTTLDADIQRRARDVLDAHLAGLASRNVRDGAVLIVENATGNVLAYVGAVGDASTARAVDGVRAHRQAGSTLKPFLYELALERGYLTAASLLNDSSITLETANGIYLPQDYDRDFKGLVSVRTALGSSLNIPAVRTIMLTGVDAFRDRLNALGYAAITEPGDFYGYSLALGSAEVSLWEQVQAYRALARGGRLSELRVRDVAANTGGHDALASAASFIIADILSDRAARTLTFGLDSHLDTPFWSAVKTGTSKDMRDNWCIGFSRSFTVGVWVGNFEGDAMHDVSGVTGAAPVWQELMLALHARLPSPAPSLPVGVVATMTRFSAALEAPRHELFIGNSAAQLVAIAPSTARIVSPANGTIIAIDPDIPSLHQRVPINAHGVAAGMVLRLNGALLGSAASNVFWSPARGSYLLALQDAAGHTLDEARFIVR